MKKNGIPSSSSPTWQSWRSMRQRCNDPGHSDYHNYGGRGIKVCSRWDSFALFFRDMGERPPGTTLERIKNHRGYEPGNCRWATASEQARNRRPPHRDELGRFAEINHLHAVRIAG